MNDCDNHNHNRNQLNDNLCNFSFELSDNYNYRDANTPSNSSPASSSCLHSPGSFPLDSPSPPPTTADFCEFFQASGKITKELGDLTLTDKEQRELYEAAKVIQKAYRSYKGMIYALIYHCLSYSTLKFCLFMPYFSCLGRFSRIFGFDKFSKSFFFQ